MHFQSQSVQIANLKEELANVSGDLKDRIDAGLHEVMYNKESFAGFASSGLFSGADAPSIQDDEGTLTVGFKTFLLTKAMTANKWFSRAAPGLEQTPSFTTPCYPNTPDSHDCYWDQDAKLQYTIMNTDHRNKVKELQTDIVQKGWSNYPLLFQGSVDCAAMGGYGGGNGQLINFQPDGTLDLSCFSQLDTCAVWFATSHAGEDYTKAPCITPLINGWCPVRTCTRPEL